MAIVKAPIFNPDSLDFEQREDMSPMFESENFSAESELNASGTATKTACAVMTSGHPRQSAQSAQEEQALEVATEAKPEESKPEKPTKVKLPDMLRQQEAGNFLERIANETFGARRRANALRSNGRLMAACATSPIAPERIVELTGRLAVEAMAEMGFDVAEPSALMEGAGPLFVRSATDIVSRLSRTGLDEAALTGASRKAVKAMLAVSRNATIARFAQNNWPDDLDAKTALKFSMTNVMSSLAVEMESFSFMLPRDKALKHAGATISKAFVKYAQDYFDADLSKPSRIMLMQSLMSNAAELYLACWQEEKAAILPKIAKAAPRIGDNEALRAQLEAHVQARLEKIDARFSDRFGEVMGNTLESTDKLFETLFAAAKRRPAQKGASPSSGA